MSQANVEVIRRGYEALARGDVDAALACLHPEVEVAAGRLPGVGEIRGREAFREFVAELFSAFDEVRLEPERFIDAGEKVVVPVTQTMRGRGGGVEVVNRIFAVWHVRDGLAIQMDAYADEQKALEAAGLGE
jgi:ketosteroid isomerase-like protein